MSTLTDPQPVRLETSDAAYPPRLQEIRSPPPLWLLGQPPSGPMVAVVGTRRPDRYGRRAAAGLAAELVRRGYGVVSGLAPGIDTEAHRGALEAGGRTWAVVGCGVDRAHSDELPDLPGRIRAAGGLVSEVPPGQAVSNQALVARDRIQTGLSEATVVVQTDLASGTMHTARFCLLQDRPLVVLAPPAGTPPGPGWAGNVALAGADGCSPDVLHARGRAAGLIAARRPVADLVIPADGRWGELWARLEQPR